MLIGIDGNEANVKNRVGVNEYAFRVLLELRKLQDTQENTHEVTVFLAKPPLSDMPRDGEKWKYRVLPGGGMWIIRKLMPQLYKERHKCDVFFTPSHYVPPLAPCPRVSSIMDLGYLKFTEQFKKYDFWQLKLWSAYSINVSKRVIAISQSTRDDIVRHYPKASKKTAITLLAYDKDRFNSNITSSDVRRVRDEYTIGSKYLLFISMLKPSKNVVGLLEAFSRICNEYSDFQLVVAGKKGWLYEPIFRKTQELGLERRVIYTDFVPEARKPALMAGAYGFVLPSFWEGFGLDVLNALACGVPVVVSDRGSLPEVSGPVGIRVDPDSIDSIALGLKKLLGMGEAEYSKLSREGMAWAKRFSWEKTARETLAILEDARTI